MNETSLGDRVRVISALIEGNSVNSTVRMTRIAKTSILRLIKALGDACLQFHNEMVCNLPTKRVQMDELWAFVHCKEKNIRPEIRGTPGIGDTWTWTALDADSKLMIAWHVGPRHGGSANAITSDVAWRLKNRVQVTTDGFHAYWDAMITQFNCEVDFAQLVKLYGPDRSNEGKYSPPECIGIKVQPRIGAPDRDKISTSFVERSNLTARMGMRRYTRLTNGHSKKLENHVAMTNIYWTYYNWCRIHATTRQTPAMAAGLTTKLWEIEDLIGLLK